MLRCASVDAKGRRSMVGDMLDISRLPKVELHVHLEGTIRAATALKLAERHGVDPASLPLVEGEYPDPFDDFEHFVRVYLAVSALVQDPEDLRTIAADFARAQVAQNVRYTEVTFTALTHVRNGMDPEAMWDAVVGGLSQVEDGFEINLIVDAVRDMGPQHALDTIALVEATDAPIVGLGLTGIENSVHEREFKMLRDAADRLGLGLAVHAGETGTPANVLAALDDLGAQRIGHGVASVEDPGLVERLVSDQTMVEVCPSSNVALGIFPDLGHHPFPAMYAAGLNVTVNSDDPPFFSTTLTEEIEHVRRLCGLDDEAVAELQRRGAGAAFAPQETKDRLLAEIDDFLRGETAL